MATELAQSVPGWERVEDALGEICACHTDLESHLQSLAEEFNQWIETLINHHRQLQQQAALRQGDQTSALHVSEERLLALQKEIERRQGDLQQSEELQQQYSELKQERALLENELESIRSRAAELTESLSEEKRAATERQSHWGEELSRMRSILETIARRQVEAERQAAQHWAAVTGKTPASDPVLGSVLAQFELIEKDCARRRET